MKAISGQGNETFLSRRVATRNNSFHPGGEGGECATSLGVPAAGAIIRGESAIGELDVVAQGSTPARIALSVLGAVAVAILVLASARTAPDAGGRQAMSPSAARGLALWRAHDCVACHAVYGLGGHVGPDLTNVWRRRPADLLAYRLRVGGGGMPNLALDRNDVQALLAYLQHLDSLGTYPLPRLDSPAFGIAAGRQP